MESSKYWRGKTRAWSVPDDVSPPQRRKQSTSRISWRTKQTISEHGQLCALDLLAHFQNIAEYPSDAVCILGVTLQDLFIDEGDDFTQGLAGGLICLHTLNWCTSNNHRFAD